MNTKQHFDWIAFLVVVFLGTIGLILSAGIIYLSQIKITPDAAYYTLAGASIGALGSMLVNPNRSQGQRGSDTPAGTPDDPISTDSTVTAPEGRPLETVDTEAASADVANVLDETP